MVIVQSLIVPSLYPWQSGFRAGSGLLILRELPVLAGSADVLSPGQPLPEPELSSVSPLHIGLEPASPIPGAQRLYLRLYLRLLRLIYGTAEKKKPEKTMSILERMSKLSTVLRKLRIV